MEEKIIITKGSLSVLNERLEELKSELHNDKNSVEMSQYYEGYARGVVGAMYLLDLIKSSKFDKFCSDLMESGSIQRKRLGSKVKNGKR